jgi:hypothetical protein
VLPGYDRYGAGTSEMRWRLLGAVPVVTAIGPDVTRGADGRLTAESAFFVPTALDFAAWADGPKPDVARCTWRAGDDDETVDLQVAPAGALQAVIMQRWKQGAKRLPFGSKMHAERRFAGGHVPVRFTGWWDTRFTHTSHVKKLMLSLRLTRGRHA